MKELEFINVAQAKSMSEQSLKIEIGKRARYLNEIGMDPDEAENFVASLLSIGAAVNEKS